MNLERPPVVAPEKEPSLQEVMIRRSNGNVHPAKLTGDTDEQGRSIVKWLELNPESGRMEEYTKPVAEQGLGSEAQEILRAQYEQRLNEEMGGAALNAVGENLVEEADTGALEQLLERAPMLREFSADLRKIAIVRAREEKEGHSYGMDQYTSSEAMIDKLVDIMNQIQKSKLGENRREAIYKYIDLLQ